MSDQPALSDLCSICYTQKPKYRCPGCRTQTCSLPCYKRHQQRASCNGKRDPTVFVKRSQLATPAGIDQDYNYLKSVERSIDHAARETSDRGVGVKTNSKGSERALHPESLLNRYLISNRINIERAPKGMSRQKTNQTRFTKRQNVLWTVEWIGADGLQHLQVDVSASTSIRDAYELMMVQRRNASVRTRAGEILSTKRKRASLHSDRANKTARPDQGKQPDRAPDATDSGQLRPSTEPDGAAERRESVELSSQSTDTLESEPRANDEQPDEDIQSANLLFYLLKPGTSSASKVLIPLDSQATLTKSLQNQTLLEYPTIYALPQSTQLLPPAYLLESEYEKIRKGEEDELKEAINWAASTATPRGMQDPEPVAAANAAIDPQRILDMLKRDITR